MARTETDVALTRWTGAVVESSEQPSRGGRRGGEVATFGPRGGGLPVQVEVWPVGVDAAGIWLLSGEGPWTSPPLSVDCSPHEAVCDTLARACIDGPPALIHSTSWRHEEQAVLLSYAVAFPPAESLSALHPAGRLLAPALARAVGSARRDPTEPPTVRAIDVLLHALRHLQMLVDTDVEARRALSGSWQRHLAAFAPALAGLFDPHRGAASEAEAEKSA